MSDTAIIIPTRDRPARCAELLGSWQGAGAVPWFGVDEDQWDDYDAVIPAATTGVSRMRVDACAMHDDGTPPTMVEKANVLALRAADAWTTGESYDYVGFLGDDHRPRTPGWDRRLVKAIVAMGGSGVAYGNDLHAGMALPTAMVMSADIVRALGWMIPPTLMHYQCDDFWRDFGKGVGRLAYLDDVVIEHLHPNAGKAERDDLYMTTRENCWTHDERAWAEFRSSGEFDRAIERVRTIL